MRWFALLLIFASAIAGLLRLRDRGTSVPDAASAPLASAEKPRTERSEARTAFAPEGASPLERACARLRVPAASTAEYQPLIDWVKRESPFATPQALDRARVAAAQATNELAKRFYLAKRRTSEWDAFSRAAGSAPIRDEAALKHVVQALGVPESSPCASAYLDTFYANFVQALDPYGALTFDGERVSGGWAEPGDDDDAGLLDADDVLVVSLKNWDDERAITAALSQLELRVSDGTLRTVVLNLASASGSREDLLAKVRDSAAKTWGAMPLMIWVNGRTRGAAEVFAAEEQGRANVTLIGRDARTAGYARKQCTETTALAQGLPAATLTIGCQLLSPIAGRNPDGTGLAPRFQIDRLDVDTVVAEARRWSSDRVIAMAPPQQVAQEPGQLAAEAAPADGPALLPAMVQPAMIQPEGAPVAMPIPPQRGVF